MEGENSKNSKRTSQQLTSTSSTSFSKLDDSPPGIHNGVPCVDIGLQDRNINEKDMAESTTYLHDWSTLPGNGAVQEIFRTRQEMQDRRWWL